MTVRNILDILGQVAMLVGRLAFVGVVAVYHRSRALAAFNRELRRLGVPHHARQVLLDRYREALPLNPLAYTRRPVTGSSLSPSRAKRRLSTRRWHDAETAWDGRPEALNPSLRQSLQRNSPT